MAAFDGKDPIGSILYYCTVHSGNMIHIWNGNTNNRNGYLRLLKYIFEDSAINMDYNMLQRNPLDSELLKLKGKYVIFINIPSDATISALEIKRWIDGIYRKTNEKLICQFILILDNNIKFSEPFSQAHLYTLMKQIHSHYWSPSNIDCQITKLTAEQLKTYVPAMRSYYLNMYAIPQ